MATQAIAALSAHIDKAVKMLPAPFSHPLVAVTALALVTFAIILYMTLEHQEREAPSAATVTFQKSPAVSAAPISAPPSAKVPKAKKAVEKEEPIEIVDEVEAPRPKKRKNSRSPSAKSQKSDKKERAPSADAGRKRK